MIKQSIRQSSLKTIASNATKVIQDLKLLGICSEEEWSPKIENNEDLPDRFKSYEKIFRNSILKSLGLYEISSVVELNPIPEDNTKLILTIFSFILVSTILISLSFDMYKKFNAKSKLKFIEKDQIYLDVENIMSNFHHEIQNCSQLNTNTYL